MKNSQGLVIVFMLIGLFALSIGSSATFAATYNYDFVIFGKTYTAIIITNSEVSNIAMSQSGCGIQFQASSPSGSTGFFNVTVPDVLLGSDITVYEDGVALVRNVSYTLIRSGADYLFYLEYGGGTHTFVIEASTTGQSTPTPSPPANQSGFPFGTTVTIAAVGVIVVVCAVLLYAFKGAIFHSVGGGVGSGSVNVPVGAQVTVHPHPHVSLTFSQITQTGAATATSLSSYPVLPNGLKFLGPVFDIRTTAVFAGLVIVGIAFDDRDMREEDKKKLRVYRNDLKEGSVWEDVTSSIDTKNNIAYGATDHFSLFGVR